MTCTQCGQPNGGEARFCQNCGTPLPRRCPKCGTSLAPTARFCSECGLAAGGPTPAPATAPSRFASPESYTPSHLAEKILLSRHAREGERKQVTVLFAD